MSPELRTRRDGSVRPARYRSLQWPVVVWMTLVWMALWRSFTWGNAVLGVVVAVLICLVFPLPPLRMQLRPRPIQLAWLVIRFGWDVIVSSVQVAGVVLRPNRKLRNAVVQVDLTTPSDFVLTVVAEMTSLIPGSIVVEARRSTHTLFLHVLNVRNLAEVEKFRQAVLAQEQRVLAAFKSGLPPVPTPEEAIR
ncbi:Na+/H+ antiporter subunit E [Nocardioides sp. Bht2]|uniref:Na+/H+ antiporter subunit E n=1 Tax=Nocardioides sp. Bht2 TaxID=3392297 RepID=UPI0039B5319E